MSPTDEQVEAAGKPTPAQIEAGSKAAWAIFSPADDWESRHFYSQKCKTMDAVEAALTAALARPAEGDDWRTREFMKNVAGTLDVLALQIGGHGVTAAQQRLGEIANILRSRASRPAQAEDDT